MEGGSELHGDTYWRCSYVWRLGRKDVITHVERGRGRSASLDCHPCVASQHRDFNRVKQTCHWLDLKEVKVQGWTVVWWQGEWWSGLWWCGVLVDLFLWPVICPQPALGVLLEEAGREIGMKGGNC